MGDRGQGQLGQLLSAVRDPEHGPCQAVLCQAHTHSPCWVWCPVAAHTQEQMTPVTSWPSQHWRMTLK